MTETFAKMLKKLRTKEGLSQLELAKEFSLSQNTICMWESGKTEPNLEMLQKIADYFKTDINHLLSYPSDKEIAFKQGLQALNLEQYKTLSNDDKQLLAEQFNALIDRLEKK